MFRHHPFLRPFAQFSAEKNPRTERGVGRPVLGIRRPSERFPWRHPREKERITQFVCLLSGQASEEVRQPTRWSKLCLGFRLVFVTARPGEGSKPVCFAIGLRNNTCGGVRLHQHFDICGHLGARIPCDPDRAFLNASQVIKGLTCVQAADANEG